MGRALVSIFLLMLASPAIAANERVGIPREGWSIAFDSPPLSGREESRKGGEYAFRASPGRFNVSLFVENPRNSPGSHRDCYEFYWPLASRNPRIASDTVRSSETPNNVRVQYDIIAEFQGQPIRHLSAPGARLHAGGTDLSPRRCSSRGTP